MSYAPAVMERGQREFAQLSAKVDARLHGVLRVICDGWAWDQEAAAASARQAAGNFTIQGCHGLAGMGAAWDDVTAGLASKNEGWNGTDYSGPKPASAVLARATVVGWAQAGSLQNAAALGLPTLATIALAAGVPVTLLIDYQTPQSVAVGTALVAPTKPLLGLPVWAATLAGCAVLVGVGIWLGRATHKSN